MKFLKYLLMLFVIALHVCASERVVTSTNGVPNERGEYPVSYEEYLFRLGKGNRVHFTLEYQLATNGFSPPLIFLDGSETNLMNVDALVARVRSDLTAYDVIPSHHDPSVIHIVEKRIRTPAYPVDRIVSIDYSGLLAGKGDGLIGALAPQVPGLALEHAQDVSEMFAPDYSTRVQVSARNSTVRDVVTECLPVENYKTVLWRAVVVENEGKLVTTMRFYGPQIPPGSRKP